MIEISWKYTKFSYKNENEIVFQVLANQKTPLGDRFDALFHLKSNGSVSAMAAIAGVLSDPKEQSALLKHELAYCIGQMQLKEAVPLLSRVLENDKENTMVRNGIK